MKVTALELLVKKDDVYTAAVVGISKKDKTVTLLCKEDNDLGLATITVSFGKVFLVGTVLTLVAKGDKVEIKETDVPQAQESTGKTPRKTPTSNPVRY